MRSPVDEIPDRWRLFIAIPVPELVKAEMEKAQAELRVNPTIYYIPLPSYLDVSTCIARGEKVLNE